MSEIPETHFSVGEDGQLTLIEDKSDLKPKRPPMFHVVLLNDDYTEMDFVVELLMQVFQHPEGTALDLMMEIHEKGEAIVATYSYDVAESRVAHVNTIAQNNGFPLRATMRPE